MNPQAIQQMTQLVQQLLQVLQTAGGAGDAGESPEMMDKSNHMYKMDDPEMMDDSEMGDEMMGDPTMMGDGMPMEPLDKRVANLEAHMGLKKSANTSLIQRIDNLENFLLGEEFQGPIVARVQQLEKSAGISPARATKKTTAAADEAPDVIPLDALIKSAVQQGIKAGLQAQEQQRLATPQQADELPDPKTMRKSARQQSAVYGQRRASAHTVVTDADLAKAAGYNESELDEPVGFGDFLMAQYRMSQSGSGMISFGDDEDDDE